MIKVEELRVGNIVNTEYGILSVHVSMLADIEHHGFNVDPISLTPEILEKCGFENQTDKKDRYFIFGKNNFKIARLTISEYGCSNIPDIVNPFQYLHQLQNLYFALTGEELTVNLSEPSVVNEISSPDH